MVRLFLSLPPPPARPRGRSAAADDDFGRLRRITLLRLEGILSHLRASCEQGGGEEEEAEEQQGGDWSAEVWRAGSVGKVLSFQFSPSRLHRGSVALRRCCPAPVGVAAEKGCGSVS